MDPYSMMIMISIGNVVGWLAGMYVKNALRGQIGHVLVNTIGAFVGGIWLSGFLESLPSSA